MKTLDLSDLNSEYLRKLLDKQTDKNSIVDRLRCFFESSRTDYNKNFRRKWGTDALELASICVELFFKYAKRDNKIDFVYINALLWFMEDKLYKEILNSISTERKEQIIEIQKSLSNIVEQGEAYTPVTFNELNNVDFAGSTKEREDFNVVLLCPNPMSLYSLLSLELLKRKNINVKGVFIKNIFSFSRLKSEFRRDGTRLLKKVWRKLILRSSESGVQSDNIESLLEELKIEKISVPQWCKNNAVPVFTVNNYKDDVLFSTIKEESIDLCVFTGGGIVNEQLLNSARIGVLNCHMGILPSYRGMDVVQWPLLERRFDQVGLCAHLMEKKIDAGPIVNTKLVDASLFNDLYMLRNSIEKAMPSFLIESVCALRNGTPLQVQRTLQRTYFRMHPKLEERIKAF